MVGKRFNRLELREVIENRIGTKVEPSSLEELENSLGGFDGFTSALKTGRFEQKLTRRDFAKLSGSMLAILTGLPTILQSCATTGPIKEEGPVHYPKLPGQKIQSPEHYGLEGCMTGIWVGHKYYNAASEVEKYEQLTGKQLSFWMLPYNGTINTQIANGFNYLSRDNIEYLFENEIIPFITYEGRQQEEQAKY